MAGATTFNDRIRSLKLKLARACWDRASADSWPSFEIPSVRYLIQTIVVFRTDGKLGDAIVSFAFLRELRNLFSGARVIIYTTSELVDVYRTTFPDFVVGTRGPNCPELQRPDLMIDFSEVSRWQDLHFWTRLGARFRLGFAKSNWQFFQRSVEPVAGENIGERYARFLRVLGWQGSDLKAMPPMDLESADRPVDFKYILFNAYAGAWRRSFSTQWQIAFLRSYLRGFQWPVNSSLVPEVADLPIKILLLWTPASLAEATRVCQSVSSDLVELAPSTEKVSELYRWIGFAEGVLTPDTSIVHIATAFQRPLVAVFRDDADNLAVWAPRNPSSTLTKVLVAPKGTNGLEDEISQISPELVAKECQIFCPDFEFA